MQSDFIHWLNLKGAVFIQSRDWLVGTIPVVFRGVVVFCPFAVKHGHLLTISDNSIAEQFAAGGFATVVKDNLDDMTIELRRQIFAVITGLGYDVSIKENYLRIRDI